MVRLFWQNKKKDRKIEKKEASQKAGVVRISKMYRISGSADEVSDAEFIEVKQFPRGVEPARVGTHLSMTVNLGNFNSVKTGVYVELPCVPEEIDDAFTKAREIAEEKINKEIDEIKAWRNRVRDGGADEQG